MKVAILAGGLGTRLGEETDIRPKPMVEIGGKPILWHIMKIYSHYGFNEFVLLCGYKQAYIKEFFLKYYISNSDVTFDLLNNSIIEHKSHAEPWKVTVLDTGADTFTGGRIKRAQKYLENERFMLTYGDGVADIDIHALIKSHEDSKALATLTAIQPEGKFGVLSIEDNNRISTFQEKPKEGGAWINGGFFVLEPEIFKYLPDHDSTDSTDNTGSSDNIIWEQDPLRSLAADGQLNMYKHYGFWRPMDMLKDKLDLNTMWKEQNAPWKIWK